MDLVPAAHQGQEEVKEQVWGMRSKEEMGRRRKKEMERRETTSSS